MKFFSLRAAAIAVGALVGCAGIARAASALPRPDHVVIVIEENHSFAQITRSTKAPYIHSLAAQGASFVDSHGVRHPSQPNYIALFSGSTQGVRGDACRYNFDLPNLASQLLDAGLTFGGFAESLPAVGSKACLTNQGYARKHVPWADFTNLPDAVSMPFTSFPADFGQLPTVSIVVPNQRNDMHSGPVARADAWLLANLDPYVQWAKTHNSLLILTWDEGGTNNQIPTFFVGPMVMPGQYAERIDHYDVLATVEAMFGLAPLGEAAGRQPIADVWVAP